MPPLPFSSPGYQFWTVEYLMLARSSATNSTTAACNWLSSRIGAVQPSRYDTTESPSAMISVRSNCPVCPALMRKYVDNSIGQRTPFGMNTNEPSENTAEFNAAKKLSPCGTTVPRYWRTRSPCSRIASDIEQKITPTLASCSRAVLATDTESNTASTATPASLARSCSGTPSLS